MFKTRTYDLLPKAADYVKGLFKSEKKRGSCVGVAHSIGSQNNQRINHLISDSPWDHKRVLVHLANNVSRQFASHSLLEGEETALLFDEVGFRKKGDQSACCSHQYLGCIGKHDTGQVAVASALSASRHYCPIDLELFMPKCWEEDIERRGKAKIPDDITHRTKPQMAWDMLNKLRSEGIAFDYVNFDALYGSNLGLLHNINKEGIAFIGDVRSDITVFLNEPQFYFPEKQTNMGRKHKHPKTDEQTISLKDYQNQLSRDDFSKLSVRQSTKGQVIARFHKKDIWVGVDKYNRTIIRLTLLIRIDKDGTVKYSFSNTNDLSIEQLAKRQAQRVFVERVFEEGKN